MRRPLLDCDERVLKRGAEWKPAGLSEARNGSGSLTWSNESFCDATDDKNRKKVSLGGRKQLCRRERTRGEIWTLGLGMGLVRRLFNHDSLSRLSTSF